MYKYSDKNIGEFTEVDQGHCFTYESVLGTDQWAVNHNLPHIIHFRDGIMRYGRVLKTIAYVCIDEAADGTPVLEKWKINRHVTFNK